MAVISLETLFEIVAPVWSELGPELSFLLVFALGFAFLRLDLIIPSGKEKRSKKTLKSDTAPEKAWGRLQHAVESQCTSQSEHDHAILEAWREGVSLEMPAPVELLRAVTQSLLNLEPDALIEEVKQHMSAHCHALCHGRVAAAVLDIPARAGRTKIMGELAWELQQGLNIRPTMQSYEVLLGGYATAGDEKKVASLEEEIAGAGIRMSPRGVSLVIKGFLKNGLPDPVLEKFREMKNLGFPVPPFAVAQLLRVACDTRRSEEIFTKLLDLAPLNTEAVVVLLESCLKRHDLQLAMRVEETARKGALPLPGQAYDPLLKLYVGTADPYALKLFEEMQQQKGLRIKDGLCVGLLARCAETKFLRFAEEVVKYARANDGMSVAMYSALMKVYAYCGLYEKACDLYDQIIQDGLEPDSIMYGCLMKFAVECGRTDLSQKFSEIVPAMDIQNYMTLIRAAGRERNVDKAFSVLDRLKAAGVSADTAVMNSVLDVCASVGDLARAKKLSQEMRDTGLVDIVTYNILIKGFCQKRDVRSAKEMLVEMIDQGLKPNDISYNCLINAAVNAGSFKDAWATIDMMQKRGVAVDHFTISIMMKALKWMKDPQAVAQALDLLDRSGIDVCSDEILLNSVLETCIRHREQKRLDAILKGFSKSQLRPSVHLYGSLIKACSVLKRTAQSWVYWNEIEQRGMQPNEIVLGCMLDALVCNQEVEQAVDLLAKWKTRVAPNTVMYSTLLKGFACTRQNNRAMDLWRQMRSEGLTLNSVVYNAVIDAQARVGAMDEVSELVETMEEDSVVADTITYSTIVKGYSTKGDIDKALDIFRTMQKSDMVKDSIVYNTLIDGCTRHGRFDVADLLIEEMEESRIVPSNFTLGILVKMYGKRRKLDKAFQVIDSQCKRFNFTANVQVQACLMHACMNNNAMDRAIEVFDSLKVCPGGGDSKSYNALILGCIRHNRLEQAVNLVEEVCGLTAYKPSAGVVVETEPLKKLLEALKYRGLTEKLALPLLSKLRQNTRSAAGLNMAQLQTAVLGAAATAGMAVGLAGGKQHGADSLQRVHGRVR